jgi:hypothetical protein
MFFDSEIEFYARADSRRVFCEYATTPMEQNLADSRMAPSGAKRSLRLAVRPNFLTLAGPNSNFPMMGWTRVKVFNRPEGGVCTMCAPRDQRKSGDDQFKQVEVNELWHQRLADISGGHIKWSLLFKADVERRAPGQAAVNNSPPCIPDARSLVLL